MKEREKMPVNYSHHVSQFREGEHFISEHILSYQIRGTLVLNDGNKEYKYKEGSLCLIRRNQLMKFVKQPPLRGAFESVTIYLTQKSLKGFSLEFGTSTDHKEISRSIIPLDIDDTTKYYIYSLLQYRQKNDVFDQQYIELKLKEGIMLILQSKPELNNILFDFTEPYKINLEEFMNKNYHFNVHLERFAYLTGRSIATFKRDFKQLFNTTPHRWLQKRRLEEAHYLIKEEGKMASEIYLDLGFEDLSHFSYAFKKQYGLAPSMLAS